MRKSYMIIAVWAIAASACASSKVDAGTQPSVPVAQEREAVIIGSHPVNAIPKAVIYKTNGDYNANVAVQLNGDRTQIISYPAPTDVSVDSEPLPWGDGWLLDRRGGIGLNTAFLRYTYAEYAALDKAPTVKELMQCIIPEARVTEIRQLQISLSQALKDLEN